jgi:hypothetical protein
MATKEMVFGWCKNGKHDACRIQYGGDRIVCNCDAPECKDVHGKNYKPIKHVLTDAEIAHADKIIQGELVETTRASNVENRAVRADSSIWGPQISRLAELDEDGSEIQEKYGKIGDATPSNAMGYGGYKSVLQEIQDASTIEELEARRLARW